ncbi:DUF2711 family protein [uncultured Jannaschia sp.]|uniref:DUF2711 family protein n=1 Tax=uncultured Jannaschia sp. TaxID=293347 RepID=UPI00261D9C2B|nr:DUF2711 family protein [uncultured Jannaschia sp.]
MFIQTPNSGRILDAYYKHFSSVWVVLSPFLKPQKLSFERFCPETYPTRNEILADCKPVTWAEILDEGSFETLSDIDIALRSHVYGLTQPSQCLKDQLINMIEGKKLIPPDKGSFAPHNEQIFLLRLKDLGRSHVLVFNEFGEQTNYKAIDDMLAEDSIPPHGVISTEDGSILVGSHWDSCCSFLCTQEHDDQFGELEKFLCSRMTEVYWGLHPI